LVKLLDKLEGALFLQTREHKSETSLVKFVSHETDCISIVTAEHVTTLVL